MGLNGTGKGSRPKHNSASATVKNTKLKSTGGSIAKNNTNFRKGPIGNSGGIPQRSTGEVITNPQFDQLHSTGRPAGAPMKVKKTLPAGMTQATARKLPIKALKGKSQSVASRTANGASDSTVSNLKSYLARKAKGQVR